jgi:hypothetical protein
VIRTRARSEGESIQAYIRERVLEMAKRPTKVEVVAAIDEALAQEAVAISESSIVEDVHADR